MQHLENNNLVAVYARLSVEDGEQSTSIDNQIEIIKNYCNENNLIIKKIYSDDGYSGSTFERPAFKQMIADLESGICNCVITKDISRFGRNLLGVGHYIDEYFPINDIRYISVTDRFDTAYASNDESMTIKMFLNDYYVKECRKKSKKINEYRAKNEYMTSLGVYGYIKNEKGEVVIDPNTAPIVVRIFNYYLEGKGPQAIANILNAEKIPSPAMYKKLLGAKQYRNYYDEDLIWKVSSVSNIIDNREYTGDAVNLRKIFVNNKEIINPNPIILENTHPAIISKELYEKVHALKHSLYHPGHIDPNSKLSKFFFCPVCKRPLVYEKYAKKNVYRDRTCNKYIDAEVLHKFLYEKSLLVINKAKYDEKEFFKQFNIKMYDRKSLDDISDAITKEKNSINYEIQMLFEKYSLGEIDDETYLRNLAIYNDNLAYLEKKENEYKVAKHKYETDILKYKEFKNRLFNLDLKRVNKIKVIRDIIQKVVITNDGEKIIIHKIEYKI